MTKSALQIARAAYVPKMPEGLWGNVRLEEGAATNAAEMPKRLKNFSRIPMECLL